jgi:hypothetical protein
MNSGERELFFSGFFIGAGCALILSTVVALIFH